MIFHTHVTTIFFVTFNTHICSLALNKNPFFVDTRTTTIHQAHGREHSASHLIIRSNQKEKEFGLATPVVDRRSPFPFLFSSEMALDLSCWFSLPEKKQQDQPLLSCKWSLPKDEPCCKDEYRKDSRCKTLGCPNWSVSYRDEKSLLGWQVLKLNGNTSCFSYFCKFHAKPVRLKLSHTISPKLELRIGCLCPSSIHYFVQNVSFIERLLPSFQASTVPCCLGQTVPGLITVEIIVPDFPCFTNRQYLVSTTITAMEPYAGKHDTFYGNCTEHSFDDLTIACAQADFLPFVLYAVEVRYRLSGATYVGLWSSIVKLENTRAAPACKPPMMGWNCLVFDTGTLQARALVIISDTLIALNPFFADWHPTGPDGTVGLCLFDRKRTTVDCAPPLEWIGVFEITSVPNPFLLTAQFGAVGDSQAEIYWDRSVHLPNVHVFTRETNRLNSFDLYFCWKLLDNYTYKIAVCPAQWHECLYPRIMEVTCSGDISTGCITSITSDIMIETFATHNPLTSTSAVTVRSSLQVLDFRFLNISNQLVCVVLDDVESLMQEATTWSAVLNYCDLPSELPYSTCGPTTSVVMNTSCYEDETLDFSVTQTILTIGVSEPMLCLCFDQPCLQAFAYNITIFNGRTSTDEASFFLHESNGNITGCPMWCFIVPCEIFKSNESRFSIVSHLDLNNKSRRLFTPTCSADHSPSSVPTFSTSSSESWFSSQTSMQQSPTTPKGPLSEQDSSSRGAVIASAIAVVLVMLLGLLLIMKLLYDRHKKPVGPGTTGSMMNGVLGRISSVSSLPSVNSGHYESISNYGYAYPTMMTSDVPQIEAVNTLSGTNCLALRSLSKISNSDGACSTFEQGQSIQKDPRMADVLGPSYIFSELFDTELMNTDGEKGEKGGLAGSSGYTQVQIRRILAD